MPYDKPDMELFSIIRDDISDELVRTLLKEQREVGLFMRYSLQHWDMLKETHPNLSRYIAITSYQAAPYDAVMREKVAASLLGLCMMVDTAMAERFAKRLGNARHIADTSHYKQNKSKKPTDEAFDVDANPPPSA